MTDDFWKPLRASTKRYMPVIVQARWVQRFQLGSYQAMVGTDCISDGLTHYLHVMYVSKDAENQPCLAVTSEYSPSEDRTVSPCLCLFFGGQHLNAGVSQDWTELDIFVPKALEMAAEALAISEAPRELPL